LFFPFECTECTDQHTHTYINVNKDTWYTDLPFFHICLYLLMGAPISPTYIVLPLFSHLFSTFTF
jgi:hypothetical protein